MVGDNCENMTVEICIKLTYAEDERERLLFHLGVVFLGTGQCARGERYWVL